MIKTSANRRDIRWPQSNSRSNEIIIAKDAVRRVQSDRIVDTDVESLLADRYRSPICALGIQVISGVILGLPLMIFPSVGRKPAINLLSGFVFALLVIVPWWMAMSGHAINK